MHDYESVQTTMTVTASHFVIRSGDHEVHLERRDDLGSLEAAVIMLELDEDQRQALDLPPCEAVTGGTALCMRAVERPDIELPTAPTCWAELVDAELWPMAYLGATRAGAPSQVLCVGLPNAPKGQN